MKKSTKKNLLIAGSYSIVLIIGMVFGPKFARESGNKSNGSFLSFGLNGRGSKLEKVLQLIDNRYVDAVNQDSLQRNAIQQLLKTLDPHSAYLPPSEARLLSQDLEGNFGGIGIEYFLLSDTLFIVSVNKESPAAKSGLKRGDRILSIGGENFSGSKITNTDVVEKIRGKKGSTVRLLIKTAATNELKTVNVLRDIITVSSVNASYMISGNVGYIKIGRFGSKTNADFSIALTNLKKEGLKDLILDLRQNGGGYLNSATELADEFLPEKKLIVYTEGKHEPRTDYLATSEGEFEQGGLVILIDEHSASASEIVAGAMQDQDRGTVIGRRSFGKGLVQQQVDFGDGSALNLTIARYFTPSGRSIQKSYKNGFDDYYGELSKRFNKGEAYSENAFKDSIQKQKAYKTSKGRLVYGGGGVLPDIFVAADTSAYTTFYHEVYRKGLVTNFVYRYLVPKYRDLNSVDFLKSFMISKADFDTFLKEITSNGIKANPNDLGKSKAALLKEMKALLGRYYFGEAMYYSIVNSDDLAVKKALEVF